MNDKPCKGELAAVAYIFGLEKECENNEKHIKEILKDIPDGWRRYRLASSTLKKLREEIWDVLPDRHSRHLRNLQDYGEVVIRPRPFVKTDDVQFVSTSVFERLVNIVLKNECAMCLKYGKEAKRCQIWKDISVFMLPTEEDDTNACPLMTVVQKSEYGNYVKE